jgi:hypothetical protein
MPKLIELMGQTFGAWTVISHAGADCARNRLWLCICACGKEKVVGGQHLRSGASKSCGCKTAGFRGEALRGSRHYNWKGGGDNPGSEAWANSRLDALRQGVKKHGGAEIVSTAADVLLLWQESKGECVICRTMPEPKNFHLDHDKNTGRVRGFLCGCCNVALGMCGDSPDRLRKCADYLESK